MPHNVVITGVGVVTRDAPDTDGFRHILMHVGQPPNMPRQFDSSRFRAKLAFATDPEVARARLAAALGDSRGDLLSEPPTDADMDCAGHGILATLEAAHQAGLDRTDLAQAGCSLATTSGGMMDSFADLLDDEDSDADIEDLLAPASPARVLNRLFGLSGPLCSFSCACVSSLAAISYAFARIRAGDAPLMITGGSDRMREADFAGFNALRAMDRDSCRPFDETRKGMMIGDGSAILVLEAEEFARARGAHPLMRLSGIGLATDSHHITSPNSLGLTRAMEQALRQAGRRPDEIAYVNCHGTGTPLNDAAEAKALSTVFGALRDKPLVSSTKGSTGHLLGTAGAIETVATLLAIGTGEAPVMTTTAQPYEMGFRLPLPNSDRRLSGGIAMKNSLGFGGLNASLILERYDETRAH